MRKMRLDLDSLDVESFAPANETGAPGTVHGHVTAYWELCYPGQTEAPAAGCGPTENTCPMTCNQDTCYQCGTVTTCPPNTLGERTCTGFCCLMEPPTHP